jgi:hypothetical protein
MPHLVQMQNKLKEKGLVVISVDLDDPADKDQMAKVQEILTKNKMTAVTNLVLNEEQKTWKGKFAIAGVPCMFLFNRDGQWKKLYGQTMPAKDGQIIHEKIEEFVDELLRQPARGK